MSKNYKPSAGQLCQVYKGFDNVYPVKTSIDCFISDPLVVGELVIITKSKYEEEQSSYYIEFIRDRKLYCCHFYEQVLCFGYDSNEHDVYKKDPISTFDFPWVVCE